ncbi:hypothetical protein J4E81_005644 [Alternaria sp. BMP 2799]|nr:hypothetical protein J4E81_005644 [Alternaria sp. BMP 2799]
MVNRQRSPVKPGWDAQTAVQEVDEATPLFPELTSSYEAVNGTSQDPERGDGSAKEHSTPKRSLVTTISILLIGVFISQADTSLVLATYGKISSEFHDLESGSWLLSSYMLAMCISQPLFGKLSDIFGRKSCLQVAYVLFAIGTLGSGLGRSMAQIIAARTIQGAGGAGMVCMVSILLTDLLPFHEVALYRSYVNVVQTVGRSCGGVIGGFLASTIGWRWAFLAQVPPVVLSIVLVQWKLDVPQKTFKPGHCESTRDKLRRIDFIGAVCMSITIFTALLVLDTGGQKYDWNHPVIVTSACVAVIGAGTFVVYERTGSYKAPTILASASSALSFTLLLLFWHGHTTVWGSLLMFPAGFATGMAHSAVFVGLTSAVAEDEVAIAGSGLYLSGNVGGVTGVSGAAAAFQIVLQMGLKHALEGRNDASEIVEKATSDIAYIQHVGDGLRELLMPAYIHATQHVFGK